jgi:hypothetical protein
MADNSSKDSKPVKKPVFQKPVVPNFPGNKANIDFRPTGRFQSINRSRR